MSDSYVLNMLSGISSSAFATGAGRAGTGLDKSALDGLKSFTPALKSRSRNIFCSLLHVDYLL